MQLMSRLITPIVTIVILFWPASLLGEERADYCAATGDLVILLLDTTTPYDESDKAEIIETVNESLRVLKGGDRLIVRTITDSYSHSERLFDRCKPYCKAGSTIDRYLSCNDGIIRSDTESDSRELVQVLKARLAAFKEQKHSDIIRTLVAVAKEEIVGQHPTSIIIFSDLIENSDHLSGGQLFNLPTSALLKDLAREGQIAALSGAHVRVAGVGRAGTAERRPLTVRELNKLTEFWTAYFNAAKATVEISQHLISSRQSQ